MKSTTHQAIEVRRLSEQARLDGLKSAAERNQWGQFATPAELAGSITRHVLRLAGLRSIRFLDPAVGTGSFYSALRREATPSRIAAAVGVELDPLFSSASKELWAEEGLSVVAGDFTRQTPPKEKFNLILTNPPYVRHHHLKAPDKDRLRAHVARDLGLDVNGLAGLYCYFLLLSDAWMADGGVASWLIPSEFMDVNYGSVLRDYLADRVTLLQIHRFCPTDVQFSDALVSSAVVIFRKKPRPAGHAVRFSFGGSIENPNQEAHVPIEVVSRSRKWTQFPANTAVEESSDPKLGDLFSIKRGLATGSNNFFVVTEEAIAEWKIPQRFLKPILPGPRHLTRDIIDALPNGSPNVSPRLHLVDCSEPEEKIKTTWPRFYEYLQMGKGQRIHEAYLASRRSPWYSQEQRPPAPFLCTYMGRTRDGRHPFRFIWNRSQATAHNVYLMLYPKPRLEAALKQKPGLAREIFTSLQQITPAELVSEGRVYGGGLHKVEPSELAHAPARTLLECLAGHIRFEQQLQMFS